MSKQIPLGDSGDTFMVADRMILVRETESVIANTILIGAPPEDQKTAFLLTFSGRINKTQETDEVTLAISPTDMWDLMGTWLDQFDLLRKEGQ